jgi:hypothetical protein
MAQVDQWPVSEVTPVLLWICTTGQLEKGLLQAITRVVARVDDAGDGFDNGLGQASGLCRKVILGNA